MTHETHLEREIEQALADMTTEERELLAAWCAQQDVDERTAVLWMAMGELRRRLQTAFGDLLRLHS